MSPNLDFSLGFGGQGRPRDPGDPIRLLVLGDFSGRASRNEREPLAGRRPRPIDLDSIDEVFAMLAPQLRLELSEDLVVTITPRELDDLHPDRIYETVDAFGELRSLRARLADPKSFAQAAETLRGAGAAPGATGSGQAGEATGGSTPGGSTPGGSAAGGSAAGGDPGGSPSNEEGAGPNDFERLLGGAGGSGGAGSPGTERSATSPAHRVRTWIENLVGPHIVPDRDPTQDLYLLAVDDTIGGLLRTILHHPRFQAMESAWRSLLQLVQETAGIESARVVLFDASTEEWIEDLLAGGQLAGLLSSDRGLGDSAWSWVVIDARIGGAERELRALAALADAAAVCGTAVAGVASPALLGIPSFAEHPEPRDWAGPGEEISAAWTELRARASAGHLALAAPRTLLRLPYGKATDKIDRFAFEELSSRRNHEEYLWGNPGYALVVAATLAAEGGQAPALGSVGERASRLGSLTLTELPVHVVPDDGGPGMKACAEVFLTEGAAEELSRRGFTPLVSIRNSNRAKVWRFRSVSAG